LYRAAVVVALPYLHTINPEKGKKKKKKKVRRQPERKKKNSNSNSLKSYI